MEMAMSRSRKSLQRRAQLKLESLEARIAPAFDLTIGGGKTASVVHDAQGDFTANGVGATISVADIRADLLAGRNVTISNGKTGTAAGNITWNGGSDLDYQGIGVGNQRLTIFVDPSAAGGTVTLNSQIFNGNGEVQNALSVSISATRDLLVNN